jgi:hypothetical protein
MHMMSRTSMQFFTIDCHRDRQRSSQCTSVPCLEQRETTVMSNWMWRFELAGKGHRIFRVNPWDLPTHLQEKTL